MDPETLNLVRKESTHRPCLYGLLQELCVEAFQRQRSDYQL